MSLDPQAPVTALKGVGPGAAARLANLGIERVQDLLFHLPMRYQDRRRIWPIGGLRPEQEVAVRGRIELAEVAPGKRPTLIVRISDGTGFLSLRFFHFHAGMRAHLRRGLAIWCFGETRAGLIGLEMVHPEWQVAASEEALHTPDHLTPFYPATEGITQQSLRRWMAQALEALPQLPDLLPELDALGLPDLHSALRAVHQPIGEPPGPAHPAHRRLAFEELLAHRLALQLLRGRKRNEHAPTLQAEGRLWQQLLAQLPFEPTAAQRRVIAEIGADLARPTPMQRLLQGDVGAGKTLVAVAAALHAIEAGYQVALMAPTEILAEQHRDNMARWLDPLGVKSGWLAQKQGTAERRAVLDALAQQELQLAVGTHALFQEGVQFARLGLVIIDEQHRFGVHQRLQLRAKGDDPHLLVMTATPIPRTLAMTVHADLDLSVLDELPPGRSPVDTVVISDQRREEVVERVRSAALGGRQVYWVCPLIEESEALQLQAAEQTYAELGEALPELGIGLVHGRMKSAEKSAVMSAFKAGEIQLLVATTVIEVGVDVPNASLMIIEHAERLGLAQLHQLRGRVGRGAAKSACVLMYHPPLSLKARARLQVMRESQDGFVIARKDLEIRGPGEFLGVRQTGLANLRIADLNRDEDLLERVAETSVRLRQTDPQRCQALVQRWLSGRLDYGEIA
ncbi:MAG: ATP-dependent DNA helicase RecG [Pseudomonadota bacterium]